MNNLELLVQQRLESKCNYLELLQYEDVDKAKIMYDRLLHITYRFKYDEVLEEDLVYLFTEYK